MRNARARRFDVATAIAALDLSWVLPNLAVGGRLPVEAAEHLSRKLGIRRVVDLRVEDRDDEQLLEEHGIELLHLPTQGHVRRQAGNALRRGALGQRPIARRRAGLCSTANMASDEVRCSCAACW